MASARTKLGHGLAKVLGIKLEESNQDPVTRGESVFSVSSADTYVESEPTVQEWVRDRTPSGRDAINYFWSLFPFTHWIGFYNTQWLLGDLVAGKLCRFDGLILPC
jgi:sodium-independent sulfate anion transporter 11